MRRFTVSIGNTTLVNFPFHDLLYEIPLTLLEESIDWTVARLTYYHVFGNGVCPHGYFIQREASKFPFCKRKVRENFIILPLSPICLEHKIDETLSA